MADLQKARRWIIPVVIMLVVSAIILLGRQFASIGIESGWYASLVKPSWTPPGSVISAAWGFIYLLTTLAAIGFWAKLPVGNYRVSRRSFAIKALFISNALLNIAWNYTFFIKHSVCVSAVLSLLLVTTVVLISVFSWKLCKVASSLLFPYILWGAFATILNFAICYLNPQLCS